MTTFVALGDSITVGMGDPAPGGGWRGWAALLGGSCHPRCTTWPAGALAADVERVSCRRDGCGPMWPAWWSASTTRCAATSTRTDRRRRPHGGRAAGGGRAGAHHAAARPGTDVRAAGSAGPAAGPPDARGERGRGRGGPAYGTVHLDAARDPPPTSAATGAWTGCTRTSAATASSPAASTPAGRVRLPGRPRPRPGAVQPAADQAGEAGWMATKGTAWLSGGPGTWCRPGGAGGARVAAGRAHRKKTAPGANP